MPLPSDQLAQGAIAAALRLADASETTSFCIPVPNTTPPLYVSLHEGPVFLGTSTDTESTGGVPGSAELRTLVRELERCVENAASLGDAQQAVYDFVSGLRKMPSPANDGRAEGPT
jgi:hypothetical protein